MAAPAVALLIVTEMGAVWTPAATENVGVAAVGVESLVEELELPPEHAAQPSIARSKSLRMDNPRR
jgi:hypothetical protein